MSKISIEWDILPRDLKINLVRLMNDSESLSIAASDLDSDVRLAVAINHSTSDETLKKLAKTDENGLIKKIAKSALEARTFKSPF